MFFNPVDNRSLYSIFNAFSRMYQPLSDQYLDQAKQITHFSDSFNIPGKLPYMTQEQAQMLFKYPRYSLRWYAGMLYLSHVVTRAHPKPQFNIDEVEIDGHYYDVIEKIVDRKSFCNLIHFKKETEKPTPKMLLVAPMSGHYATLLRGTVQDMLPHFDVYITDWKNARDVPLAEGSFDLEEFSQYIISYMHKLGPDCHVMAVCQSAVPVLVALALLSTAHDPKLPLSLTILGGPIDTDQAPTAVNDLVTTRSNEWFKQNVISIVPGGYPGYMRLVYPGFMQLMGFMSMNMEKHLASIQQAVENFAKGDIDAALKTVKFYEEYFSTMDLTAEFYMQTINTVFQQKLLTKGRLKMHGKDVLLRDIKKTALLAIEGELDDITGVGQTRSILDICHDLPDKKKKYVLAKGVGHYGLFNGGKFRNIILPEIINFATKNNKTPRGKS